MNSLAVKITFSIINPRTPPCWISLANRTKGSTRDFCPSIPARLTDLTAKSEKSEFSKVSFLRLNYQAVACVSTCFSWLFLLNCLVSQQMVVCSGLSALCWRQCQCFWGKSVICSLSKNQNCSSTRAAITVKVVELKRGEFSDSPFSLNNAHLIPWHI